MNASGLTGRWHRLTLRGRLILIGSVGVAAGLALGGLILVRTLEFTLQRNLDEGAAGTAHDVAALAQAGRLSDPIPVGGGESFVQVVDAQGRVSAASAGTDRLVPMLGRGELAAARGGDPTTVAGEQLGITGAVRVVGEPLPDGRTVLVAVSERGTAESIAVVKGTLLVAFPILVGLLAAVAWRVVGWTLAPVEALRRGAAEITGTSSARRLPVPAGNDEVHRLAVTLNDMLQRLESARGRQRAFVADAAHELRSPLASMRTQLEVAVRLDAASAEGGSAGGSAGGSEGELLTDLLTDVNRLADLTNDLLLLARADEGALPRPAERVDVAALAKELAGRYAGARVPVRVDAPGSRWVRGTPGALRRLIGNLADNAVRHAATEVVITVEDPAEDPGEAPAGGPVEGVLIAVTDDGPGIAPADRDRVFDRFTRLDDARTRDDGGSGLGLAIVRELARLHGGTVTLADAGPGVRAEVRLPAGGL